MNPLLLSVLQNVAGVVAVPLLGLLLMGLKHLVSWCAAHANGTKAEGIAKILESVALAAVAQVEATSVPAVKSLLAGPIDAATGAKLKAEAVAIMKSSLSAATMKAVEEIHGANLDQFLGGLVEHANAVTEVDPPPAPAVIAAPVATPVAAPAVG